MTQARRPATVTALPVPTIVSSQGIPPCTINDIPLSGKTLEVWQYLERHHRELGYAPSYREIRDFVGIGSMSMVWHHLHRLERAQVIRMTARRSRTIVVLIPWPVPSSSNGSAAAS